MLGVKFQHDLHFSLLSSKSYSQFVGSQRSAQTGDEPLSLAAT